MDSLSLTNPVLRLDFLNTSDTLPGYGCATKGTKMIILNDPQGIELLSLHGINGEASLPTDPICLFDTSGNRLAQKDVESSLQNLKRLAETHTRSLRIFSHHPKS
jgi:hypothetical protein